MRFAFQVLALSRSVRNGWLWLVAGVLLGVGGLPLMVLARSEARKSVAQVGLRLSLSGTTTRDLLAAMRGLPTAEPPAPIDRGKADMPPVAT